MWNNKIDSILNSGEINVNKYDVSADALPALHITNEQKHEKSSSSIKNTFLLTDQTYYIQKSGSTKRYFELQTKTLYNR